MSIRIILLDLDGTLLTRDKRLSPGNRRALERAAAAGIWVVPATGRFYQGMPAAVRELPFVRYAVTVNGAQVYDAAEDALSFHPQMLTLEQTWEACRILERRVLHGEEA